MLFRSGGSSDTSTTFRLSFIPYNPVDFNDWMIVTAGLRGGLKPEIKSWESFETVEVPDWNTFDEILLIASPVKRVVDQAVLERRFRFRFEVNDSLTGGATETAIRRTRSNPLSLSAESSDGFEIESSRAEPVAVGMRILTLDGRMVRGTQDNDGENQLSISQGRSTATLRWNGTTASGEPVASGIYLAMVEIGDRREILKIAVKNKLK